LRSGIPNKNAVARVKSNIFELYKILSWLRHCNSTFFPALSRNRRSYAGRAVLFRWTSKHKK